ncbi:MAG: hypothetical protein JRN37_03410 [Nitrososphaerota archaeon]|jgi:hypothetical protein|nr:hypothetical protein [Nitrososphaerota archaeon]MDG7038198.1 hypothetical protein [Nitrososphaerota archaeon]MDG7046708.1 hypothetical protein [Nitrososphaerota archaeon]MDG7048019.1 hypothetical protein [Nitrososphaerota archaeon]
MNFNPFHKKDLPDYESRIRKLERYHGLILLMTQKAQYRSDELYQMAAYELKRDRKEMADMYANEYMIARKVLDFVRNSELMLLRMILRLQTINEFNKISSIIFEAFKNVERIKGSLNGISIASDGIMDEMNDALSYLHGDLISTGDTNIDISSESAEEILGSAVSLVKEQMTDLRVKEPTLKNTNVFEFNGDENSYENIQENLIEMIKKGETDLAEAI